MQPTYIILTVEQPLASARFYEDLLKTPPVDTGPTFCLFVLKNGTKLGLWSRSTIEPAVNAAGGSAELGFAAESPEAVDACHKDWQAAGVAILQPPTQMDFGYTFTAADPDGHRLRVFALDMA